MASVRWPVSRLMKQVLMERNAGSAPLTKKGKSVEDIYQKKTQLEHILLRPDSYIGSVEKTAQSMMVVVPDAAGEPSLQVRAISIVPGLFKIFDELVGAKGMTTPHTQSMPPTTRFATQTWTASRFRLTSIIFLYRCAYRQGGQHH